MEVVNKKWSEDYFFQERTKVLAQWPTGKDVCLEDAVKYHQSMPKHKNVAIKALEVKEKGITTTVPSTGTDTIAGHKELLLYMQNVAKADFLTTYIDSLTRNCHFEAAQKGLQSSLSSGKAVLNGFPIVVHGVSGNREVLDALDRPVIIFGPTPDLRLTMEVGLAGGHTAYFGGPLISFWNYTKNVPVEQIIHNVQYVNRLMGYYEENNIPILYCVSGAMPATSTPSLMIGPQIIEILIAAEQGVKHVQLNCWVQGNLAQDIAHIKSFQKLAREYLDKFGFTDVRMSTYSVSPTGRFPADEPQVYALIAYYAMVAVHAKVQLMGSRTIDEAYHVPTKEGNAKSFICAKMMIDMLEDQQFRVDDHEQVKIENYIIERETRCIVDKVLEMGDGDIIIGTSRAIAAGVLDQSFATSQLVKGQVLGVKDINGASRVFDFGNLPFDAELKDFHREKLREREKSLGKKVDIETVINDLKAISNGAILPK